MDIPQELPSPLQLAIVQPVLATKGQRFKGHLLDFIFFTLLKFLCAAAISLILAALGVAVSLYSDLNWFEKWMYGLSLYILYYFPQELLLGKTFGKRIMGTRAVREDGTEMTVLQTLGRAFCRLIPFDALSFLGDDDHPRGWHDTISKTMVIVNKPE